MKNTFKFLFGIFVVFVVLGLILSYILESGVPLWSGIIIGAFLCCGTLLLMLILYWLFR